MASIFVYEVICELQIKKKIIRNLCGPQKFHEIPKLKTKVFRWKKTIKHMVINAPDIIGGLAVLASELNK